MKLKRILSGFLAGAVALSSMVFSASAADPITLDIAKLGDGNNGGTSWSCSVADGTISYTGVWGAAGWYFNSGDADYSAYDEVVVEFENNTTVNGIQVEVAYHGGETTSSSATVTDASGSITCALDEDLKSDVKQIVVKDFGGGTGSVTVISATVKESADTRISFEAAYDGSPVTMTKSFPDWGEWSPPNGTAQGEATLTFTGITLGTTTFGEFKSTYKNIVVDGFEYVSDSLNAGASTFNYCIFMKAGADSSIWNASSSASFDSKCTWSIDTITNCADSDVIQAIGVQINIADTNNLPDAVADLAEGETFIINPATTAAYTITIANTENGTVVAKVDGVEATEAEEDATVALEVTPDEGYALDTLAVTGTSGNVTLTEDNTFLMPAEDVTVTATFVAVPTYTIAFVETENGTVETDVTEAKEGDTVTVTATPDKGYELDSIVITGESGTEVPYAESSTEITFVMPAENVMIAATFAEIEVEEITISPVYIPSLLAGSTIQLTAEITPEDALDKDVTWTSSDDSIATVSSTGLVKGVAEGTVTITAASANGVKGTATIKVTTNEIPATAITLSKTALTLEEGASETITATVTPEDSTDMVIWDSSDPSVATVVNGKITAIKKGETTIIATAGAVTAECIVTVEAKPEATGYDKVEANFEADTIVAQKATNADGTTNVRIVKMVKEADIYNKGTVTFTLVNKAGRVKIVTSKNYYVSLIASGNKVTPKDGYVFLAITITDIPEGEEVTCTNITLS